MFDDDRGEAQVRDRGRTLGDRSRDPLGPGWFGEQDSRTYAIVYKEGRLHRTHAKTSMMSGVYYTDGELVDAP